MMDCGVDYEKLQKYVGAVSYEQLKRSHRGWVEEYFRRWGENPPGGMDQQYRGGE